ncbi:MAG: MarR family transcriptional regulator [Caldilineaceae bacterium SB0670_bin_27]|uniref:MarR family transcriptional regulator n=1 Tax=Caldilineaceae bacterium SB0664_bin_27 TaxID=2605260 RepID=A0A6B0YTQ4_9CHLR|nr:MarR family transcriptional regulator [Caldilineaceae bacterium SB0664_bin_27]MYJ77656.1 MarR family transcriptional regulator [Caldilineaceae bacterium SB0670_bin_27]
MFLTNLVLCRIILLMTKVSNSVHPSPQCSGAANSLSNAPGDADSQQVADDQIGFRQLLAESGVDHVQGMEILRLIKMCAGAYDRILGERMRDEEVSLPQWRILIRLYLAERNGQAALMPTDLAHSLCLSKNTISAHLRALEVLRLIERQLDPNDLRAFRIRLTTDSRSLIRSSAPLHLEFFNDLIAHLSPEECEMLQGLLARLVESLQRKRE